MLRFRNAQGMRQVECLETRGFGRSI